MASGGGATPRRHRYARASTASVSQLLSDGCSSLISRLTRRPPSEKPERLLDPALSASVLTSVRRYEQERRTSPYASYAGPRLNDDLRNPYSYVSATKARNLSPVRPALFGSPASRTADYKSKMRTSDKIASPVLTARRIPLRETNNNIINGSTLGSTRSRLEDKYSSVLDKIANRRKEQEKKAKEDRDKTLEPEPSMPRGIVRSLTTAMFGDRVYPYAALSYARDKTKDKTPYRSTTDRKLATHKMTDIEAKPLKKAEGEASGYAPGKDRNSVYRRHYRRSLRVGKSETDEPKLTKLTLRATSPEPGAGPRDLVSPTRAGARRRAEEDEDEDRTPTGDPAQVERETRRKEIQSLIMKYAALDEVYGRLAAGEPESEVAPAPAPPPAEARARRRPQRPRHQLRRAATPPVRTKIPASFTH